MFELSIIRIKTLSLTEGGLIICICTLFSQGVNKLIGNGMLNLDQIRSVNEIISTYFSILKKTSCELK